MAAHRSDRRGFQGGLAELLDHPVRMGILSLGSKDRERLIDAKSLSDDLREEDPATFGRYSQAQIAYHRARLKDAGLLPSR